MINDLIHWVVDKVNDQRSYPRKSELFAVSWLSDSATEKQATGLEISANGLVFQMKDRPGDKELNLGFTIRNRPIRARVKVRRVEKVPAGEGALYRFVGMFLGISAEDWDAIVRFVNDEPEPANRLRGDLADVRRRPDDAYRLLPLKVQNELVRLLVRTNRLEAPPKDHAPVLRLHLIETTRNADGTQTHRVNIHSRKRIDDAWYAFDTQFRIHGSGKIEEVK